MNTLRLRGDSAVRRAVVALDDRLYRIRLAWNGRAQLWSLDLATAGGDALLEGVRVVVDQNLLQQHTDPRLPRGKLVALDRTGSGVDPKRSDLGGRIRLIYVPAAT